MINYSKNTICLIDDIIHCYVKNDGEGYYLNYSDIPDFDREKIVASLMADDESFASEAVGPDNPAFNKNMLSTLINFMKEPNRDYNMTDFIESWRAGISNYGESTITDLIDRRLEVYAHYMKYEGEAA